MLFNPFLRTCYAPTSELPDGGTGPSQEQTPPATPPAPAAEGTPADTPPPPHGGTTDTPPPPGAEAQEEEADFSLDKEPPPPAQEQQPNPDREEEDGNEEKKEPEKEYVLELPDDLEVTDEFRDILKEHAKDSGLDGKAAGQYVSGVIKAMEEAERTNITKGTRELREDWGKNFNANMDSVKSFAAKLRKKSGLAPEDLAPLQSPKGYRLLHALQQLVGEDTFVDGKAAPVIDPQKEAQRMLTDPSHRYYKAIHDQTDPLFLEANHEYNRLVGYPS